MKYDETKLTTNSALRTGYLNYKIINATKDNFKVEIDNLMMLDDHDFILPFNWPDELKTDEEYVEFTNGLFTLDFVGNDGVNYQLCQKVPGVIRYYTKGVERVYGYTRRVNNTIQERPDNAVAWLGSFYIKNLGSAKSCEKNIIVNFPKEHLVTAMNCPSDVESEYIKIKYTLTDEDGEQVILDKDGNRVNELKNGCSNSWSISLKNGFYKSKAEKNIYVRLTRTMLPKTQQKYYFKILNYNIKSIPNGTKLEGCGDTTMDIYAVGNYCGYLNLKYVSVGDKINATMTFKSSNSNIEDLVITTDSLVVDNANSCYGVFNASFSKNSILAGESVEAQFDVSSLSHLYSSSAGWLKNIRLGLVLPSGAKVNKNNISVRTLGNYNNVAIRGINYKKIDSEKNLWYIDLDPSVTIGYGKDDLSPLPNGTSIRCMVQIDTVRTMNTSSLFTDTVIQVVGMNQSNESYSYYDHLRKKDSYDLNEDGRTNDYVGRIRSVEKKQCAIVPNPPTLEINDCVYVDNNISDKGENATLINEDSILNYELNIACKDDGVASNFEYYIPITKINSTRDKYLVRGKKDEAFNLQLQSAATLKGDYIYTIEYCVKDIAGYLDARKLGESNWYTATELKNASHSFKDVTLIRLTVTAGKIEQGMDTTITVKMKYSGNDFYENAGAYNTWKSCGFYNYDNGTRVISGHFPSNGCTTKVGYSWDNVKENEAAVFLAKQNEDPLIINKVEKRVRAKNDGGNNSFPKFSRAQSYYIKDIETQNVVLKNKDYIIQNQNTMSPSEANENFAFTIKLNDGDELDLSEGLGKTIGTTSANEAPQFEFEMFYGSNYNDKSLVKIVTVTIASASGVEIRLTLQILFEDKNKVVICNGEDYIINTSDKVKKVFYMYDIDRSKSRMGENIEFYLDKVIGNGVDKFVISTSSLYADKDSYLGKDALIIIDDCGNKVDSVNNTYKLDSHKQYKIKIIDINKFGLNDQLDQGKVTIYLHSYVENSLDTKEVDIVRRKSFNMH